MELSRRGPAPDSHDMNTIIPARMDMDEHGGTAERGDWWIGGLMDQRGNPAAAAAKPIIPSFLRPLDAWFKKRSLLWLAIGFWLFTAARAEAQIAPADDFFHSGAQSYITNNLERAKEIVAQGRKLYPADEKLKKLEELLNQQQQQQQQQQNQQQQKQDQSQQQKSDDQKNQDPAQQAKDSEDQKKSDEQKKSQEEQNREEQKKPDPKSDEKKKDGDKKDEAAQPVKAGEMTPEEARRLLDSQKGSEQLLQWKPQEKPRKNNRPIKDW